MTDFLKLAAGLSVYNDGRYNGYAIGRAYWQLEGQIYTIESRMQSEKEAYAVIEVNGFDKVHNPAGRLTVTLIKSDGLFRENRIPQRQSDMDEWFCFTWAQAENYLEQVQDTNPIHRGEGAVVPGLMLIDLLLDKGFISLGKQGYTMRFKAPLFMGSHFVCLVQGEKLLVESPDKGICYAEVIFS